MSTIFSHSITKAVALIGLALIAAYLSFFDLNRSFSLSDESLHVQVTQEMWQSGNWWLPTHAGEPYFRKPPFKMWLTFLPLSIWGEENFSYRVIDATLGVIIVLGICLFTERLSGSLLVGVFAGILYLFNLPFLVSSHGFRYATQDPMLRTLQFFALWIFYEWYQAFKNNSDRRSWYFALGLGFCVGFSILSKNVLGLVAPGLALLFLVLRLEFFIFIKKYPKQFTTSMVLALSIPLAYMLPHFVFTPGAFQNMFMSEVVDRSLIGEHYSDNPLFYLQRFGRREFLPLGIMLLAIGYGLFASWKKSSLGQLLLIWSIVPVVAFSLVKSRLFWYIAESFVGLSILSALAVFYSIQLLVSHKNKLVKISLALLLIIVLYPLPAYFNRIWFRATQKAEVLAIDKLVSFLISSKPDSKIAVYAPAFSYNEKYTSRVEKIYIGKIKARTNFIQTPEELQKIADTREYDFVFVPRDNLEDIHARYRPEEFMTLNPTHHRNKRVYVFAKEPTRSELFKKSQKKLVISK